MYWELCCLPRGPGFSCELSAGTYCIGDPFAMLLPGIAKTVKPLSSGSFVDAESDSVIAIHWFGPGVFIMDDVEITSDSGFVAIMNREIVKPLPEFERQEFTFDDLVSVEVNTTDYLMKLTCGHDYILTPFVGDLTDEEKCVQDYAALGVKY